MFHNYKQTYKTNKELTRSRLHKLTPVQPNPEKMRLEMVIGMQTEILDGHPRSFFERLI